jgi:predicted lysophospholipase L1 biosynthesis ABC-type transport system permease subunit
VAVVNQAFARKFNLGTEVVGKRMQVGSGGELDIEIVGLAQDAKYSEVKREIPPIFFLPYRQDEKIGSTNFYVRFGSDPTHQLPALRRTVAGLDSNLPIENLRTLALQIQENILLDRILSLLSAAFALLATLLAAVGLYGVMAFSVARRTREIGLRMALGADAGRVRRLVLGQVGRLTLAGSVLGLAAAFGVGRAARSLLFELEPDDPLVFVTSAVTIVAIALAAGFLPAHRASTIEPIRALREE